MGPLWLRVFLFFLTEPAKPDADLKYVNFKTGSDLVVRVLA